MSFSQNWEKPRNKAEDRQQISKFPSTWQHICMFQRTPEGKQIRQYFIDLRKPGTRQSRLWQRALKMADAEMEKLKSDNQYLIADNERMETAKKFLQMLYQQVIHQFLLEIWQRF